MLYLLIDLYIVFILIDKKQCLNLLHDKNI